LIAVEHCWAIELREAGTSIDTRNAVLSELYEYNFNMTEVMDP